MNLHTKTIAILGCCVVTSIGCRQGVQPAPNPLSSVFATPLVPTPATNSYDVPDRYYKGQAQTAPDGSQLVASANQPVGTGIDTNSDFAARGTVAPASFETAGSLNSSTLPPEQLSTFRGPAPTIPRAALRSNSGQASEERVAQRTALPSTAPAENSLQQRAQANPLSWRKPGTAQY